MIIIDHSTFLDENNQIFHGNELLTIPQLCLKQMVLGKEKKKVRSRVLLAAMLDSKIVNRDSYRCSDKNTRDCKLNM